MNAVVLENFISSDFEMDSNDYDFIQELLWNEDDELICGDTSSDYSDDPSQQSKRSRTDENGNKNSLGSSHESIDSSFNSINHNYINPQFYSNNTSSDNNNQYNNVQYNNSSQGNNNQYDNSQCNNNNNNQYNKGQYNNKSNNNNQFNNNNNQYHDNNGNQNCNNNNYNNNNINNNNGNTQYNSNQHNSNNKQHQDNNANNHNYNNRNTNKSFNNRTDNNNNYNSRSDNNNNYNNDNYSTSNNANIPLHNSAFSSVYLPSSSSTFTTAANSNDNNSNNTTNSTSSNTSNNNNSNYNNIVKNDVSSVIIPATIAASPKKTFRDTERLVFPPHVSKLKQSISSATLKKDESLLKLFTLPQQIQRCINMGDFTVLKEILDLNFTDDCDFKNSAMKKEVRGRENILEIYKSIVATFPDFMLVVKKAKFCHTKGTIIASVHSSGTKCLDDSKETSYNLVKSNPDHRITPTLVRKANDIVKSGKRYKCLSHSIWNFQLNEDYNKVVRFITVQNIVSITEA